jgi:hypothetical protein
MRATTTRVFQWVHGWTPVARNHGPQAMRCNPAP